MEPKSYGQVGGLIAVAIVGVVVVMLNPIVGGIILAAVLAGLIAVVGRARKE